MIANYLYRNLIVGLTIALLSAAPTYAADAPTAKSAHAADEDIVVDDHDPLETINRGIFAVNRVIDGLILSPAAHIYRGVMADFAQRSVHNALSNLATPVVLLNSALQGDTDNFGRSLGRCVVNSTVGIAGLFDVASNIGIPRSHDKDFGQTMGVWGVGAGPYIMLPIVGPSDARDTLGLAADVLSDPFTWILNTNADLAYEAVKGVVKRSDLMPLTDRIYRDSLDPYASFRSIYLQHRNKVVRDYRGADAALETEK